MLINDFAKAYPKKKKNKVFEKGTNFVVGSWRAWRLCTSNSSSKLVSQELKELKGMQKLRLQPVQCAPFPCNLRSQLPLPQITNNVQMNNYGV